MEFGGFCSNFFPRATFFPFPLIAKRRAGAEVGLCPENDLKFSLDIVFLSKLVSLQNLLDKSFLFTNYNPLHNYLEFYKVLMCVPFTSRKIELHI